ncbi:hypothetical protein GSF70_07135 [Flavobacteriaceae bacterium W22]|nr:hypothetical protein [Flavobacteriaceae bacterium W22]
MSLSCKGQTNIINLVERCNYTDYNSSDGSTYLKDESNIFNQYTGTWKWVSGNKEMTLVLMKQTKFHYTQHTFNVYEDRLVGYYIYKENGVLIADTSGDDLQSDFGLNVSFSTECDTQLVGTAMFIDVKKEKMYTVMLEKLSPTQMKFRGKIDQHSSYINGDKQRTLYSGSTFPLQMVFTKQ